ncbi:hypothetical protein AMAG_12719 [Allomyces macrogynus ATCC 38327]|uniref:Uncharacterized protein n=1 Tax=Allomyces macrogynus (strain ATCC 38327) TaxID=578462 RepID=A0A0L0T1Q0_ALLM3|nr:hypothetical protein AMAG_12719 [Allomyces macrogynus ATCC 38327]|eukprot:KNE68550.1 hypothetical protein AMAG_12719 [Allomyces macrogynus ATCC 38327]
MAAPHSPPIVQPARPPHPHSPPTLPAVDPARSPPPPRPTSPSTAPMPPATATPAASAAAAAAVAAATSPRTTANSLGQHRQQLLRRHAARAARTMPRMRCCGFAINVRHAVMALAFALAFVHLVALIAAAQRSLVDPKLDGRGPKLGVLSAIALTLDVIGLVVAGMTLAAAALTRDEDVLAFAEHESHQMAALAAAGSSGIVASDSTIAANSPPPSPTTVPTQAELAARRFRHGTKALESAAGICGVLAVSGFLVSIFAPTRAASVLPMVAAVVANNVAHAVAGYVRHLRRLRSRVLGGEEVGGHLWSSSESIGNVDKFVRSRNASLVTRPRQASASPVAVATAAAAANVRTPPSDRD